jgi:geranylgeranyl diphosphate synthase, type I
VTPLANVYLQSLESTMRQIVQDHLHDEDGFGVMIRYAMGWVDENNHPYSHPTGKRLRPLLLLLACATTTSAWQTALPAATAVELLHNFSLIHDDIQDNSFTRHNRPTVWKIWGIANAINAGDAMFSLAYTALASLSNTLPAPIVLELWHIFNTTNIELTRGQHLDMRFERQSTVSIDDYISMIKGKSAALIATSAQMGALIGSQNSQLAQHFAEFALNIGIAFQIHDDILGIWGDPKLTGKSIATDIISRKKSLPILFALEKSSELRDLYAQENFGNNEVKRSVEILTQLKADEFTRQQENIYYEQANRALQQANLSPDGLAQINQFVDFLFQRNY